MKQIFNLIYLRVRLFFNSGRPGPKLLGQYLILFALSIKHQWLLGVTEQNQIKNEGICCTRGNNVFMCQIRVRVVLFCPLAKNSTFFT